MNYEQKYKAALKRARRAHSSAKSDKENGVTDKITEYTIQLTETIFPELKESEDERIKNEIIDYISTADDKELIPYESWIAWLKKQGEQKPTWSEDDELMQKDAVEFIETGWSDRGKSHLVYWLKSLKDRYTWKPTEKQGEQKPVEWHKEDEQNLNACLSYISDELLRRWLKDVIHAKYDKPINKLEAKFHKGDWIVYNRNDHSRKIMQIYDIRDNRYYFNDNIHFSWSVKECDEKSHLWTIKDAKDGDVLCSPSYHLIWIYKDCKQYYACVNMNYATENIYTNGSMVIPKDAYPATKDEQTILFERIKRAGYEWDEDKKELIKL